MLSPSAKRLHREHSDYALNDCIPWNKCLLEQEIVKIRKKWQRGAAWGITSPFLITLQCSKGRIVRREGVQHSWKKE